MAVSGLARGPARRTGMLGDVAVPRLRISPLAADGSPASQEVELYHRTYTTLLRSSGETFLRVLEPAHRAMNSSLHALAAADDLDLGAFIYAAGTGTATGRWRCCWPAPPTSTTSSRRWSPTSWSGTSSGRGCSPPGTRA